MIKIEPTFQRIPAFKIIGFERYTDKGIMSIGEAWNAFRDGAARIPNRVLPVAVTGFEDYSRGFEMVPGSFPKYHYIAGMLVSDISELPEDMVAKEVPEADYAVFEYHGDLDQLSQVYRYIYDEWLPNSGYTLDPTINADFERFVEKADENEVGTVRIHLPVVKK